MTGGKNLTPQQRAVHREAAAARAAATGFVPEYPGDTPNGQHTRKTAIARGLITREDIERADAAVRQAIAEL